MGGFLATLDWSHVLFVVAGVVVREVMAKYSPSQPAPAPQPAPTPPAPQPTPQPHLPVDLAGLLELLRQLLHATPPPTPNQPNQPQPTNPVSGGR